MKNSFRISLSVILTLIALSAITFAQQPKQTSKSPVITSDDVLRVSRSRNRAIPTPAAVAETTVAQRDTAEAARLWRERLQRAQQQVRELRRQADATELEINRKKNMLFSGEPRSTQTHKGLIADIDILTFQMRRLRAEAANAQADVDALLAEGDASGYSVTPTAIKQAITGRDEYRSRYNELNIDLLDAQKRVDVLQLRINDINRRILLNSGSGDEFYNNRLRDQLQATEDDLYDTRARAAAIRRNLEELRQEARRAGIYLN